MSNKLNIHCFMHVPFEGPGLIEDWIALKGYQLEFTRFYEKDALPTVDEVKFLVIMGGPMNVFDDHMHLWMQEEIEWVREYIKTGKALLGICLGAQIISVALGSEVYPGKEKEIGWFDIRFLPSLGDYKICKQLPSSRKVFHWHGDTFDIPEGAVRIAESGLFPNQGFIHNKKTIALQFHLEMKASNVHSLVENCREDLVPGPFIQSEKKIKDKGRFTDENRDLLYHILDYLSL